MLKWKTAQTAIFKDSIWKHWWIQKKVDVEILKTSNPSNKIICRHPQCRETVPLSMFMFIDFSIVPEKTQQDFVGPIRASLVKNIKKLMHFCVILILVYDVTLIACLAESWTDEKQQAGPEELGRQFQQCLNCTLKVSAIARQTVPAVSQLYT